MKRKVAVIIGAGPAGLTAAYEFLSKTDIVPVIVEQSGDIGGISKTVNYKGNRIDIGGHRFFSKSDRVMAWWLNILPLQCSPSRDERSLGNVPTVSCQGTDPDPEKIDNVMLKRQRISRIYYLRKFFAYPIAINLKTLSNLGVLRCVKIGCSYLKTIIFKHREEKSLEDFFINRFGFELYATFFKGFTEKVWGVPCHSIKPEWGAQRIKGLTVAGAIKHSLRRIFAADASVAQKNKETSLIEQFLYPKLGPGQLWEEVAQIIVKKGGELRLHSEAITLHFSAGKVVALEIKDTTTNATYLLDADYVISTMPVKDLIPALAIPVPQDVLTVAQGLLYRDFITVGLLVKRLKIKNTTNIKTVNGLVPDNWIYIQERDVKLGRLQIFNNWSPYLVNDPDNVWIGLEYFCNENDELWRMNEADFVDFAVKELRLIDIIDEEPIIDSVVIKMVKAYPAYFGTYENFAVIRKFVDSFANLFLIGRNGMHRYNNTDHSMLTAMIAVENIMNGIATKDNIWSVNTEEEYQE